MVQTKIEKRQLTGEDHAIIGKLLVEILAGEISPEMRKALYSLGDPLEIPRPYGHIIAYAQGYALDNMSMAQDLREEVRGICIELLDKTWEHPNARSSAWIGMYGILSEMLEDHNYDIRQNIEMVPEPEQAPSWAGRLINYARNSSTEGKELTLGLLDVLESMIKERREQLS